MMRVLFAQTETKIDGVPNWFMILLTLRFLCQKRIFQMVDVSSVRFYITGSCWYGYNQLGLLHVTCLDIIFCHWSITLILGSIAFSYLFRL